MKTLSLTGLVVMGVGIAACNPVNFEKMPGPRCQGFSETCVTIGGVDSFDYDYVTQAPNVKTDILVVDDNSASMRPEQQQMAERFTTFVNSITALDWRLGIVTTDMNGSSLPTQDGKLLEFAGAPGTFFIQKTTPSADTLFRNTVERSETGHWDERGIYAAIRALQRGEHGFIRSDAHLAVVILSDENERSNGGLIDGRPLESGRDYPQDLTNYVQSTWAGQKSLTVHSIVIRPGDASCLSIQSAQAGSTASEGTIYAQAAQATGGILGDICANDYGSQLSAIGQVQVETIGSVTLACTPIDGTLQVTAPHPWDLRGNKVVFNPPLPAGTTVHFRYDCVSQQ